MRACVTVVRGSEDGHSALTHRRPWPGHFIPHPGAPVHTHVCPHAPTGARAAVLEVVSGVQRVLPSPSAVPVLAEWQRARGRAGAGR